MFILRSNYNRLVAQLNEVERDNRLKDRILANRDNEINALRGRVQQLQALGGGMNATDSCGVRIAVELPADVARFIPDYFGGQVIKQEATKVVVVNKDGSGKIHYTGKKKADKGFSYLLVREK